MKSKVKISEMFRRSLQEFSEECHARHLQLDSDFAHIFIHLLAHDARSGLDLHNYSKCKAERFIEIAVQRYADPMDATVCNLKLSYFFKNSNGVRLEDVKRMYDQNFHHKLQQLTDAVLQFPENSNEQQLDQLHCKMQIFIIAAYNIGCPKNAVLLKHTRQALNSVLGRSDLRNYVLKKKYHRLEYLQRLGATVCGILIYNNCDPNGEKENMRDIFTELNMAKTNTKESFEMARNEVAELIAKGIDFMTKTIDIRIKEYKVQCLLPIEKVREINKLVVFFNTYEYLLNQLMENYQRTVDLISVGEDKMKCVVAKINDVLNIHTAIDSELVFPHFKYLAEVWSTLTLYLIHLTELNKVKDTMDTWANKEIKEKLNTTIDLLEERCKIGTKPTAYTFDELLQRTNAANTEGFSLQRVSRHVRDYCSLTMALTNGLLVPSKLHKKLCEDSDLRFGFSDMEYAKYAERCYADFSHALRNAIYTSVDLIVFFDLEMEIMRLDKEMEEKCRCIVCTCNIRSSATQTDTMVGADRPSNGINSTWNVWDFHRKTIHMANLRRKQTHSQQTVLTYGQRVAQNQTYNRKQL